VEKLGFRDEGVRERYMHIDGGWRDHRIFSLLSEDVPFGLLHFHTREQGLLGGDPAPDLRGRPGASDASGRIGDPGHPSDPGS
jgi:ribosomal-protein-alanine N-acetyltransferase